MSTEEYPEVSGDESGIVPPQTVRPSSEWPKRLRTLTAAELDRLTIDNEGRFYWDGKLVDYGNAPRQDIRQEMRQEIAHTNDPVERSMDALDRAAYELLGGKSITTIDGELAPTTAPAHPAPVIDRELIRAEVAAALAENAPLPSFAASPIFPTVEEQNNGFRLSGWQRVGAVLAVLGILIGALGMATYGYVAASEWGCKTGTFKSGCPLTPATVHRPDIPA